MATYVNDLRLKEIATGDEAGTWGTSTNTNLELIGEALGYGTQDCFSSDADATTTVADGATDPARSMYFKVTSSATLTATRTLTIAPNTISRVMFIENATTGSQSINISQGSGANVTIATGKTTVVYLDGAGSTAAVVDALALVDPGVTDTLAEVLVAGNTSGGTNIELTTTDKVQFRDTAIYINSSADGQLDIVADTEVQIAATTIDVNGTLAFDSLKGTGATTVTNILDEDNMGSDSATALATQQSIKAYVDSQVGSFDTLAEVLAQGNTTGGTDIAVSTGDDITFADSSKAIFGAGSDLQIFHDASDSIINDNGTGSLKLQQGGSTKLEVTTTGIDVTGTATMDGLNIDTAAPFMSFKESGATKLFIGESSVVGGGAGYYDFYAVTGLGQRFFTNSLERMRIDSIGRILIGKTVADSIGTDGIELDGDNDRVLITRSNGESLVLNRKTSDGDIAIFRKDGAPVGSIGADNASINIGSGNTGLLLYDTATAIYPRTAAGGQSNGAIDLGGASDRFKDLYLSGGALTSTVKFLANTTVSGSDATIFRPADNTMAFSTNGAERMRIDSSGLVAIGTSSPVSTAQLTVGGTSRIAPVSGNGLLLASGGSDRMFISTAGNVGIGTSNPDTTLHLETPNGTKSEINLAQTAVTNYRLSIPASTDALTFVYGASTERMRLDSSGNVGIGNSSPSSFNQRVNAPHLVVGSGSNNAGVTVYSGTADQGSINFADGTTTTQQYEGGLVYNHSSGYMGFHTNGGVERMRIDASGNVGIGGAPSAYKLDIYGAGGASMVVGATTGRIFLYGDNTGTTLGSLSAIPMRFYTNGAERMRIDASGNVGIGVVPSAYDAIFKAIDVGQASNGVSGNSGTTQFTQGMYYNSGYKYGVSSIAVGRYEINLGVHKWTNAVAGTAGNALTSPTTVMTLDASGNLLVGGTSAYAANATTIATGGIFYVSRNGGSPATLRRNSDDGAILTLERDGTTVGSIGSRGGVVSHIILDPRSGGAGLTAAGASLFPTDNAGTVSDAAIDLGYSVSGTNYRFRDLYLSGTSNVGVGRFTAQNPTNSAATLVLGHEGSSKSQIRAYGINAGTIGSLEFMVSAADGTGSNSMTLNSGGNLLLGTTSATGSGASSGKQVNQFNGAVANGLYVDDTHTAAGTNTAIIFGRGATITGSITTTLTTTAYVTSSDQRLKENIADADDAGSKIDAIQVRKFDWISDGSHQDYGMIAQELQVVAPEAVSATEDPEEMMGVDYSKLVPMMLKEIQSLRARVAQLES